MLVAPFVFVTWLSAAQAIRATAATLTLSPPKVTSSIKDEYFLQTRREIQRHYRQFGVHLPIEDIVILSQNEKVEDQLNSLMRKACGQGNIFVWVPLKFDLPILGTRIMEWCWKTT